MLAIHTSLRRLQGIRHTCKAHLALTNFKLLEEFLNSLCQRICSYYSSSIGIHLIKWQILKSSCFRLSSSPTDVHTYVARPESYAKMWQNALQLISRAMWHTQHTMQQQQQQQRHPCVVFSSSGRGQCGSSRTFNTQHMVHVKIYTILRYTHTHAYIYVYIYII